MRNLLLDELPPPPFGKTGWPWTEAGLAIPDRMMDGRSWPRLSIITPSFNQAEFIEETIRSVLLQGYPDLEYIVQDGGSQDGSVEIIRKYEKWLTYWASKPDAGQSDAINQGLDRASGHIVGWLNSDDVYLPDALQSIAQFFVCNPSASLVYGQAQLISRYGKYLGPATQVQTYDRLYLLGESNVISQPAAFFRRDAFQAAGRLDTSLHIVMDWDLWLRLEAQGPIYCITALLAQMRLYPEAKTYSSDRTLYREIRHMVERYGGKKLPTYFKSLLLSSHLKTALTAYCSGNQALARDEVEFVIEVALPNTFDDRILVNEIADWVWSLTPSYKDEQYYLVEFIGYICEYLPVALPTRDLIKRRARTLLRETLAFDNYKHGRFGLARDFAWTTLKSDPQAWKNRGLWSVALRSLLKSIAPAGVEQPSNDKNSEPVSDSHES
jgi:glycosyltransferase involved in cell wall biosynthesis